MTSIDFIDYTAFESESEREEREATQWGFHEGYFDDLAAFEGFGR